MSSTTIDDLPDEILEYIFYLLPPYQDVRRCRAVSRKWNEVARNVIPRIRQGFGDAISSQNVTWENRHSKKDDITKRYAHSACRHHDTMYVFGGFTSSFSSFNDLWTLNLSTRVWKRVSVKGKTPIPKAGATMMTYGDKLVLFGGLLPPVHGTRHQNRRLSNHVHIYDINTNTWDEINDTEDNIVPGLAGHSATIHSNKMIVFGGLEERVSVNEVYSLDLTSLRWNCEQIFNDKPPPRYGHSQVYIDETHLMIMGGVNNEPLVVFDDAWLLDMSNPNWLWRRVDLGVHAPLVRAVWCHPVCKVGKYVVVFKPATGNPGMYTDWFPVPFPRCTSAIRSVKPPEVNLNGKRGILNRTSSSETPFDKNKPPKKSFGLMREFHAFKASVIELHALDTSHLVDEGRLIHVRNKMRPLNCPTDTILYSVVEGNGELIMFGGIQRDIINYDDGTEEIEIKIINALRIMKVKRRVV